MLVTILIVLFWLIVLGFVIRVVGSFIVSIFSFIGDIFTGDFVSGGCGCLLFLVLGIGAVAFILAWFVPDMLEPFLEAVLG